jgi:DNA-binding transcriptional LysR family regulator
MELIIMEWQQIVGFHQVARLESFTRAAEATFRTQSALSQQIRALEDEFGCRLFERLGRRKPRLTPAGERFLRFSEAVIRGYENLTGDLNQMKGEHRGPLKIAAPFTTLYHLFPEKLNNYLHRFPLVELTLLDRPQGRVIGLVRNGDVDFGLATESAIGPDLASIRWKKVETVLLVPSGHPLAGLKRLTWRQIAKYPLILPPRDMKYGGRSTIERNFQRLGLPCRIAMESSNVELSSVYVEMGLGISLATIVRNLPALAGRRLEFLSLDHYFKPDHIALVMKKDRDIPAYKKAFIAALLEEEAGRN